jgi:AbrB family transcriptional regulator, transcriptional pleiotropic regulator of transition state genes
MVERGIRRKVDDLGRVVLPAGYRKALGIAEGDPVEIRLEADHLVLSRAEDRCTFCDAGDELTGYLDKMVCWSCMAAIRALDRERHGEAADPFGA